MLRALSPLCPFRLPQFLLDPYFALCASLMCYLDQEGIETDVTDPRFQATFEQVFKAQSLQGPHYKFYILAGVRNCCVQV